jgi:hypothetical protein
MPLRLDVGTSHKSIQFHHLGRWWRLISVIDVQLFNLGFGKTCAPGCFLADLPSGRFRLRIIQDRLMQFGIAKAPMRILHTEFPDYPTWHPG